MSMHDDEKDPMWDRIRDTYHVPAETPKAAMWRAISQAVEPSELASGGTVIDLAARRPSRTAGARAGNPIAGWAVAAAAVLVMGIGIGRMTAPAGDAPPGMTAIEAGPRADALRLAAREHLGRTESLLTMVRADARDGRVDPAVAGWAGDLLIQTRLLLDAGPADDATTRDLLLDLELILIQIAAVAETGSMDEAMARTELELAIRGLEDGELLPRLQAALPAGMAGA